VSIEAHFSFEVFVDFDTYCPYVIHVKTKQQHMLVLIARNTFVWPI